MGTFKWPLRIASMDGQQAREIEATVDTGASFTTLPSSLLRELGIEPMGKRGFLLADSRRIEMDYGEARATIDGDTVTTIVVFGEDEAPPLLGAYTLEGLALAVGPGGSTAGSHLYDPVLGRCGALCAHSDRSRPPCRPPDSYRGFGPGLTRHSVSRTRCRTRRPARCHPRGFLVTAAPRRFSQ